MLLRSGNSLPPVPQAPSKASTRSSKAATNPPLEPILENLLSSSDTEDFDSNSMSSQSIKHGGKGLRGPTSTDLLGDPTSTLIYKYMNEHGGHVYAAEQNESVVRISDHSGDQPPPNVVVVSERGDHYMDAEGFKFLKTSRPNEMNSWGNLVFGTRAASQW